MATSTDVPEWAKRPFEDFIEFGEKLSQVVHLSANGIAMLRARPIAISALMNADGTEAEGSPRASELEAAKAEAELANRELKDDFPILHGQAIVTLWSALESLTRTVLTSWLANARQRVLAHERLRKLKVQLAEYEQVPAAERPEYLSDVIERELDVPLKGGIGRFEEIYSLLGMTGGIDETVRKTLFEMSHVRNAIVHRNHRADRRLVDACPWLGLQPGVPIKLGHCDFARYNNAVFAYVVECIQRQRVAFGVPRAVLPTPTG